MPDNDILAEAEQLQRYWTERDRKMLFIRDVLALTKPKATRGKFNWTLNEPKVLYDTTVSLLSTYEPRFRLPLTVDYNEGERDKINKAERLCLGIYRLLEQQNYRKGRGSWLRELMYWMCSGWYAMLVMTVEDDNGEPEFIADLFDPITVYPEWDEKGLKRVARVYEVDAYLAQAMADNWNLSYTPADLNVKVKVVNFWRRRFVDGKPKVYNAIYFGDQTIKALTQEPFDRIPMLVGAVGIPEKTSATWQQHIGESIIDANLDMYEYKNEILRLVAKNAREMANPTLVNKTKTGRPNIKKEDVKGWGDIIGQGLGESLEPLRNVSIPPELSNLFSVLDSYVQRGGLPYVVYGGLNFELSGFALTQLMATIKYKAGPYHKGGMELMREAMTELLEQYRDKKLAPVRLTTKNRFQMRKGVFFVEEFTVSDVPESVHIDVDIPLVSPMDRVQQITFARQALTPPAVMSRETLWDEILDVQDSDQEYQRIVQDETLEMPIVKQIMAAQKVHELAADARTEGRNDRALQLEKYAEALDSQIAQAVKPAGTPEAPPGVGPETMPPEMSGQSPDTLRAIMKIPPPRPNRPARAGTGARNG